MTNAITFKLGGEAADKTKLPGEVFEVKVAPTLLAQAARVYLANQRQTGAKTRTRGEVAKTTAKMYRQKGTGRARHGSYSAPIFVGGGVAHGPDGNQNWKRKLTKAMSKKALLGALSIRAAENKLGVIAGADKASGKTKEAAKLMTKMGKEFQQGLLVVGEEQKEAAQAWRNIADVITRERLNTYEVLRHKAIILTSEAIVELVKYANTK